MAGAIEHVVIIVKENHTFDNYFGAFPGADCAVLDAAQNPPPDDPLHRHEMWMARDTRVGSARSAYDREVAATTFATRAEAQAALFRYIDGWYNPRRTQHLNGLWPDQYEAAGHATHNHPQTATLQPETADPR
jgi:transposase InsO family protein